MVGGLVSSTALTLILVPVLYRLIEGRKERRDLVKSLHVVHKPKNRAGAVHQEAEFQDWTTGAIPKVRGRRAAND